MKVSLLFAVVRDSLAPLLFTSLLSPTQLLPRLHIYAAGWQPERYAEHCAAKQAAKGRH